MRHKHQLDFGSKSDKEIWQEMPVGDLWLDSEVHKVWFYLISNRTLVIPDSWLDAVLEFNRQLSHLESRWRLIVYKV